MDGLASSLVHRPTLLLDFDGTVCLGDDPVRAYADAVGRSLSIDDAHALTTELATFLTDGGGAYVDGYAAVQAFAETRVSADVLAAAYLESRRELAAGVLDVWAPPGLADFLLAAEARIVVATNAPDIGVTETIATLGISAVVDEVITEAGKPAGMASVLDAVLGDAPPASLISVGDIWRNDLDVPHRRGCATALIDRHGHGAPNATFTAEKFEDLYAPILQWTCTPDTFTLSHEGRS